MRTLQFRSQGPDRLLQLRDLGALGVFQRRDLLAMKRFFLVERIA